MPSGLEGGRNLKPCLLTFLETRAFVLASTSAGLVLLKPSNDCGFLAIERVQLNFKILLQTTICLNIGLNSFQWHT